MTNDRFDFEQKLMYAWHMVDDMKMARRFLENCRMNASDKDSLDNLLLGFETKYNLIFNEILDNFESLVQNKQI